MHDALVVFSYCFFAEVMRRKEREREWGRGMDISRLKQSRESK
jgi:hypothetical protein